MRLLIAAVQTALIVGIGVVAVRGEIVGQRRWRSPASSCSARWRSSSIGYVIASFARTEESANGMTSIVQFPLMFLSGIFFPIAFMPDWLQPVAAFLPLTYLGDALRQTMVGGVAFAPLGGRRRSCSPAGWSSRSSSRRASSAGSEQRGRPLLTSTVGQPSRGFSLRGLGATLLPTGHTHRRTCCAPTPLDCRPSS